MTKRQQGRIDFAEEPADTLEQLRGTWRLGFRQRRARNKGEQPDESFGAVEGANASKAFSLGGRNDSRNRQMRRVAGEVEESLALHVDERIFTGGMHDFKDRGAAIEGEELEIVVVLAR